MGPPQRSGNPPIRRLRQGDGARFDGLLDLFSEVFDDAASFSTARPGPAYRDALLARDDIVMLMAADEHGTVGALVAYELHKFEQERSEFYICDLAVKKTERRRGSATAMIEALKTIARSQGGWVVFIQADQGDEPAADEPAIALYTKLGTREDVVHFDLLLDQ